jgi:hypothetical protein
VDRSALAGPGNGRGKGLALGHRKGKVIEKTVVIEEGRRGRVKKKTVIIKEKKKDRKNARWSWRRDRHDRGNRRNRRNRRHRWWKQWNREHRAEPQPAACRVARREPARRRTVVVQQPAPSRTVVMRRPAPRTVVVHEPAPAPVLTTPPIVATSTGGHGSRVQKAKVHTRNTLLALTAANELRSRSDRGKKDARAVGFGLLALNELLR